MNSTFKCRKALGLLLYLLLSIPISLLAQTPSSNAPRSIEGQLPEITPPAPTVANLMKFEEVPVNNYSGIPDISIPLYSVDTHSKDVNLNIALKYHPSSVAVLETASYTGLGWSLFAGGAISRTVKGSPDEGLRVEGTSPDYRIGILQDNIEDADESPLVNRYEQVLSLLGPQPLTPEQTNMIGTYGWNVCQKGIMDTEYDLYQYNFMGYTGRFMIKRDPVTKMLVPIKLDNNNNMKIVFNYTQEDVDNSHFYKYTFNGFDLFDDRGFKYSFTAKEFAEEDNSSTTNPFIGGSGGSSATLLNYVSAYNLTSIYDNNNKLLVQFNYTEAIEKVTTLNATQSYITGGSYFALASAGNQIFGLLPKFINQTSTTKTTTKKLSLIDVIDKAHINFYTGIGRDDSNINYNAPKLDSIVVSNWYGKRIKQYKFDYEYLTIAAGENSLSRLGLSKITEKDCRYGLKSQQGKELSHILNYRYPNASSEMGLKRDYWGYFSKRSGGTKQTDQKWCSTHVLESIVYPTGGSVVFDWGPNTYSYMGEKEITDFSIDDDADDQQLFETYVPADGEVGLFPVDSQIGDYKLYFVPEAPVEGGEIFIRPEFSTLKQSLNTLGDNFLNDGTTRTATFDFKSGVKYYLSYEAPSGYAPIKLKGYWGVANLNPLDSLWLKGGGLRINKISYYADAAVTTTPSKEKLFKYTKFDNIQKSSGSLVSPVPLYDYYQWQTAYIPATGGGPGVGIDPPHLAPVATNTPTYPPSNPSSQTFSVQYHTETRLNNLKYIRTQGADVGYKNVTVYETGNGKTEYTYTSPIDYPETGFSLIPPFKFPLDLDYKRGLLQKEKRYLQDNSIMNQYKPVSEDVYEYHIINDTIPGYEGQILVGHQMPPSPSPMASSYSSFDSFRAALPGSDWGSAPSDLYPFLSITGEVWNHFGWPALTKKTTNNYFYPTASSSSAQVVSTIEEYKYNFYLKKLVESSTMSSKDEVLKTKYFYDTTYELRNRIGVLKATESYRDDVLLDKKSITFSNSAWGSANTSFLPQTISIGKGAALESRVQFLKYDLLSNPLEARLENGKTTCYIWGYNLSYPIAIIENMDYATLAANTTWQEYVDNAVAASNLMPGNLSYSQKTRRILQNLNNLRAALPSVSPVTTFAYEPLVGVIAKIDPRGSKTTYSYDGFGRLEEVREKEFNPANPDEQGNLVSKNKYNFRSN